MDQCSAHTSKFSPHHGPSPIQPLPLSFMWKCRSSSLHSCPPLPHMHKLQHLILLNHLTPPPSSSLFNSPLFLFTACGKDHGQLWAAPTPLPSLPHAKIIPLLISFTPSIAPSSQLHAMAAVSLSFLTLFCFYMQPFHLVLPLLHFIRRPSLYPCATSLPSCRNSNNI